MSNGVMSLPLGRKDGEAMSGHLLQVADLHVVFEAEGGQVNAVNGLSYEVNAGEIVAILGESGSGKSVGARAVMGLIPRPPGRIAHGRILFKGQNLLEMPETDVRRLCGRHIALVPQDPLSAFNPLFPIGWQIAEVFRIHQGLSTRQARETVIDLMRRVQISAAEARFDDYPFQFSGGMRQRALIAMALALNPALLIADEPTTALDVTTQAQILELLVELQADFGMGLILITHDIGVVAEIADRVVVMYAGRVAETGPSDKVLRQPSHPYTKGLRDSLPELEARQERLVSIPGTPPDLSRIPAGCPFHPRCAWSRPGLCDQTLPPLRPVDGRQVACHLAEQVLQAAAREVG
jgi:oligopeptide/dipeptide ABC transporter ATP-binding protein